MTIREALKKGIEILAQSGTERPQLEAQILLAHLLQKNRLYLHVHADDILSDNIYHTYLTFIEKRCRRMPVAYIINKKEFMSLPFYVDEHVLIPRPDTEILVEEALRIAKRKDGQIEVLDLCCGSGCIGLSFAYYMKNAHVVLSDISNEALSVTKKNIETFQLHERTEIFCSDLFSEIPETKFDMILSNPPYISDNELRQLEAGVKDYEPLNALFGGEDGTDFYKKIVPRAKDFLTSGGSLLLEIGYDQGEKVKRIMLENGYKDVHVLKDYAGLDRVVKGIFSPHI